MLIKIIQNGIESDWFQLTKKAHRELLRAKPEAAIVHIEDVYPDSPDAGKLVRLEFRLFTTLTREFTLERLKQEKQDTRQTPIEIGKQEGYILHNEELLSESKSLFIRIQELETKMQLEQKQELEAKMQLEQEQELERQEVSEQSLISAKLQSGLREAVLAWDNTSFKGPGIPVVWKNSENDKARIKRWLGETVEDDFFNVGKLRKYTLTLPFNENEYDGTDNEKEKYGKLKRLSYNLLQLEARTNYIKTFDGMSFIPLAIQNISTVQDVNIRVVVRVEIVDIVEPTEDLICSEYSDIQYM